MRTADELQTYVYAAFPKKSPKADRTEKRQVREKPDILIENPFHPSLRTRQIEGDDRLFGCSVNMDIRILWEYGDGMLIIVMDVGHHDILRRY